MSADPLEHKVPRHVPGEQYEKAYDLANRRGHQVIELRQKLAEAEAALADAQRELALKHDAWDAKDAARANAAEAALAESRGEVAELARRLRMAEKDEDYDYDAECRATSEYMECVFHCYRPEGHKGDHHGDTAGMIWSGESTHPRSVIANPPRRSEAPHKQQRDIHAQPGATGEGS